MESSIISDIFYDGLLFFWDKKLNFTLGDNVYNMEFIWSMLSHCELN